LNKISQLFLEQTTFTISIGIGSNIHEAFFALHYVKSKQKGQIIFWNNVMDISKKIAKDDCDLL
jgi:hypothetical protein